MQLAETLRPTQPPASGVRAIPATTAPAPASDRAELAPALIWSAGMLSGLRMRDGTALAIVYAAEGVLP